MSDKDKKAKEIDSSPEEYTLPQIRSEYRFDIGYIKPTVKKLHRSLFHDCPKIFTSDLQILTESASHDATGQ